MIFQYYLVWCKNLQWAVRLSTENPKMYKKSATVPLARSGVVIGFLYWFPVALGPVSLSLSPWGQFPCSWPASRRDLIGNPPPPAEKSCMACVHPHPYFSIVFFWCFFASFLEAFWVTLGPPKASQNTLKIIQNALPNLSMFYCPFFQ